MALIYLFVDFFRCFNDAVNGFNDDGWSIMNCDGAEDVIVAVNSTKNLGAASSQSSSLSLLGGILCAKASMLLQVSSETNINVQPSLSGVITCNCWTTIRTRLQR